jgi:Uma2 family endonuclease
MRESLYLYGAEDDIFYPYSDGKPMAENTIQARWIVSLYNNLHALLKEAEAFIAADIFWYPVKGDVRTVIAPDVLVALGRPRGERYSYHQWREEGVAPQVVFEVVSPSNSASEMAAKLAFYERYGVEEYVVLYPEQHYFEAYERLGGKLALAASGPWTWSSPLLGISFRREAGELTAYYPDGSAFLSFAELMEQRELDQLRLEVEQRRAERALQEAAAARRRAEEAQQREAEERRRAEEARTEIERLRALLRDAGKDEESA